MRILRCHRCAYTWVYRGRSKYRICCPGCGSSLTLTVAGVDGHLGPATIAGLNRFPEERMLPAVKAEIMAHYQRIVERDPSQAVFLRGWKNRLEAE